MHEAADRGSHLRAEHCGMLPGHGGIRAIMDDMKLLSTEAEGVAEAVPTTHQATHVNSQQRVGALLGLKTMLTSLDGNPGSSSEHSLPPGPFYQPSGQHASSRSEIVAKLVTS